jgi:hypothetical protein
MRAQHGRGNPGEQLSRELVEFPGPHVLELSEQCDSRRDGRVGQTLDHRAERQERLGMDGRSQDFECRGPLLGRRST